MTAIKTHSHGISCSLFYSRASPIWMFTTSPLAVGEGVSLKCRFCSKSKVEHKLWTLLLCLPSFERVGFPRRLSNKLKSFFSSCHSLCVKIHILLGVPGSTHDLLKMPFWVHEALRKEGIYFSTPNTDHLPRPYFPFQKCLTEWNFL